MAANHNVIHIAANHSVIHMAANHNVIHMTANHNVSHMAARHNGRTSSPFRKPESKFIYKATNYMWAGLA